MALYGSKIGAAQSAYEQGENARFRARLLSLDPKVRAEAKAKLVSIERERAERHMVILGREIVRSKDGISRPHSHSKTTSPDVASRRPKTGADPQRSAHVKRRAKQEAELEKYMVQQERRGRAIARRKAREAKKQVQA